MAVKPFLFVDASCFAKGLQFKGGWFKFGNLLPVQGDEKDQNCTPNASPRRQAEGLFSNEQVSHDVKVPFCMPKSRLCKARASEWALKRGPLMSDEK